jgi:alanine racemase
MRQTLKNKHRLWAEINLDRLAQNYRAAQSRTKGMIMPVIKADAYGHGAVRVALTLRDTGARFFAVATPEEAEQLRRHGVDCGILLLGAAPSSHLPALAEAGVTLCVPNRETSRVYKAALGGRTVDIHIKFNTGMTRLGLPADNKSALKDALEIAGELNVTGLFTHFAAADDCGEDGFTKHQFDTFSAVCNDLRTHGLGNVLLHSANSAALLAHPYTHLDCTRPGLVLYGYSPLPSDNDFQPVLSLHTSVMQIHAVPSGTTVSYGRAWTAERDSLIATVPVGYADGLTRALSGKGFHMLICGEKVPVVGRICMDFCALDVTELPDVTAGEPVTVLGDGIDADYHARLAGTIPWEILCSIGRRVPRVYIRGGEIIGESNDLDLL